MHKVRVTGSPTPSGAATVADTDYKDVLSNVVQWCMLIDYEQDLSITAGDLACALYIGNAPTFPEMGEFHQLLRQLQVVYTSNHSASWTREASPSGAWPRGVPSAWPSAHATSA